MFNHIIGLVLTGIDYLLYVNSCAISLCASKCISCSLCALFRYDESGKCVNGMNMKNLLI